MSSQKANNWDQASKWICSISCFGLAVGSILSVIMFSLYTVVVIQNTIVAVVFLVLGVGFVLENTWVFNSTLYAVAIAFINIGLIYYQTGQRPGVLPLMLILLLIWKSIQLKMASKNVVD